MTLKSKNGNIRLGVIITIGIALFGGLWTAGMATKTLIEDYTSFRIQTDANKIELDRLDEFKKMVTKSIDTIEKDQAILKTEIQESILKINSTLTYQSTIRKELKEVAEIKANKIAVWHAQEGMNANISGRITELSKRVENLENRQ